MADNETCHIAVYKGVQRWIAVHLVLMVGVCVVVAGVVTSLLSFAMFTYDRITPKTTRFMLKTLSLADGLFLILFCAYVQVGLLKSYVGKSGDNVTSAYIAKVYYSPFYQFPIMFGLQIMEMFRNWIAVLIGIERFIVVCWPLKAHQLCAKRRFVVATVVVFISSVLLRCPILASALVLGKSIANRQNKSVPSSKELTALVNDLGNSHDIIGACVVMVLPQVILLVCTVNIIHQLRKSWAYIMGNSSKGSNEYRKRNLKVTRMLLTVIIIFSVCTLPAIVALISRFTKTCTGIKVYYILKNLFWFFSLIFSASNFFVYIVFMKRYREILRSMFSRRWRQAHRSMNNNYTVYSVKENENSTWL